MTVTLKALEATLSQIVNSAKYISMDTENRGKSLITKALRPIQGYLLEVILRDQPLVKRAIPGIEKGNALFFKVGVGCWPSTPYSSLGLEIGDADTAYKKDCYSEDTMGVSHTHNSNLKSLTVKKRMLIKNRVSYKF